MCSSRVDSTYASVQLLNQGLPLKRCLINLPTNASPTTAHCDLREDSTVCTFIISLYYSGPGFNFDISNPPVPINCKKKVDGGGSGGQPGKAAKYDTAFLFFVIKFAEEK